MRLHREGRAAGLKALAVCAAVLLATASACSGESPEAQRAAVKAVSEPEAAGEETATAASSDPSPSGLPSPSPSPRRKRTGPSSSPKTSASTSSPSPALSPSPLPSPSATLLAADCGGAPAESVSPPDGVVVTLELPKLSFARGEPVQMTIRVKNTGSEPVVNSRTSGAKHEFWVQRGEQVIWDSWHRQGTIGVGSETTLGPGEEWVATVVWDQQLCNPDGFGEPYAGGPPPPGRYLAQALWFNAGGNWRSNPVEFEIH